MANDKLRHFALAVARRYTDRMVAKPQFSLRLLLFVTAVIALIVGEAVAFPGWLAALFGVLLTVFFPVMFVAGALYARRGARAFSIGALVCWLTIHWTVVLYAPVSPNILHPGTTNMSYILRTWNKWGNDWRISYAAAWSFALAAGCFSVVVRWVATSKSPND